HRHVLPTATVRGTSMPSRSMRPSSAGRATGASTRCARGTSRRPFITHLLSIYRARGHRPGEAPVAEAMCARLVTLPLFTSMTDDDQVDVARALTRLAAWRPA